MAFNKNQIYGLKDHIVFTAFEDGGVVFNLDNRVSNVINQSGVKVLEIINGERNLEDIIKIAAHVFEQPENQIETDITHFLSNLMERGWAYVQ